MNFANIKTWTIPEGEVTKVTDSQNRVIWQKYQDDPHPYPTEQKALVDNANKTVPSALSNYLVIKNISSQNGTITFSSRIGTWLDNGNSYTMTKYDNSGNATTLTFDANNKSFTFSLNAGECIGVQKLGTIAAPDIVGYSPRTGVRATVPHAVIGSVECNNTNPPCSLSFNSDTNLYDASSFSYKVNATYSLTNATIGWFETMFTSCTNLVYPPSLSVGSQMNHEYYQRMYRSTFNSCQSILRPTSTINVPNDVYNRYMCYRTYYGCSNLTNVDNAVAFGSGSSNIINGPTNRYSVRTPQGVLAGWYTAYEMFANCTQLLSAKFSLPFAICGSTTLGNCGNVYTGMFSNCWRLVEPPKLEKTSTYTIVCNNWKTSTMSTHSYYNIFFNCYNLQKLILSSNLGWRCPDDEWVYDSSTQSWQRSSYATSTTQWMTVGANPYYGVYKGMIPDNQSGTIYYNYTDYPPVEQGNANNGYLPSGWTMTTDVWT